MSRLLARLGLNNRAQVALPAHDAELLLAICFKGSARPEIA
jgi:hypothetical protein